MDTRKNGMRVVKGSNKKGVRPSEFYKQPGIKKTLKEYALIKSGNSSLGPMKKGKIQAKVNKWLTSGLVVLEDIYKEEPLKASLQLMWLSEKQIKDDEDNSFLAIKEFALNVCKSGIASIESQVGPTTDIDFVERLVNVWLKREENIVNIELDQYEEYRRKAESFNS